MVYRTRRYIVRRLVARAAVGLVSTLIATTVVSSASPVAPAVGAALRTPALGHANEYSMVPPVTGESVSAALAALKKAKFGAFVHAPSMTALVYRRSPIAGIRLLQGAVVSIWARAPASP